MRPSSRPNSKLSEQEAGGGAYVPGTPENYFISAVSAVTYKIILRFAIQCSQLFQVKIHLNILKNSVSAFTKYTPLLHYSYKFGRSCLVC